MNFKTYIKEHSELSWWNSLDREDREDVLLDLGQDKRSAQYHLNGLPLSLRFQLTDYFDSIEDRAADQEWAEWRAIDRDEDELTEEVVDNTFDKIIKNTLRTKAVPLPKGKYNIKSGSFSIDPSDEKIFKVLYNPAGLSKDIGKGEVALYWLFYNKAKKNPLLAGADLIIGNKYVEVKSYSLSKKLIKLGNIDAKSKSKHILSLLFGFNNLFGVFTANKKDFVSEVYFNTDVLLDSVKVFIEIDKLFSSKDIEKLKKYEIFKKIVETIDKLKLILSSDFGIRALGSPEEITAQILRKMIAEKIESKPGFGGYVANISPDTITDIVIHQLPASIEDMPGDIEVYKKNFLVDYSAIKLNFDIFK